MIRGGTFTFPRVALHTTRDEVAVGIAPLLRARHDVIEAQLAGAGPAQAIKTHAALAGVNGLPQRWVLEEIQFFQIDSSGLRCSIASLAKMRADGANLIRQTHLDQVTGFAAFDQAQNAEVAQAAQRIAPRFPAKSHSAGHPVHRKPDPELSFEAAVPHKMTINGAICGGEAQSRREHVLELFPDD